MQNVRLAVVEAPRQAGPEAMRQPGLPVHQMARGRETNRRQP